MRSLEQIQIMVVMAILELLSQKIIYQVQPMLSFVDYVHGQLDQAIKEWV